MIVTVNVFIIVFIIIVNVTVDTNLFSEFELVGDFGSDVFESDGCAADPFKADSVETEPGEFTDFHFPLYQRVCVRIAVDAKQEESLPLLVIAVVRVQHASGGGRNFGLIAA